MLLFKVESDRFGRLIILKRHHINSYFISQARLSKKRFFMSSVCAAESAVSSVKKLTTYWQNPVS